jgi:hypothetical protein
MQIIRLQRWPEANGINGFSARQFDLSANWSNVSIFTNSGNNSRNNMVVVTVAIFR